MLKNLGKLPYAASIEAGICPKIGLAREKLVKLPAS
jgi:hypothetical protein